MKIKIYHPKKKNLNKRKKSLEKKEFKSLDNFINLIVTIIGLVLFFSTNIFIYKIIISSIILLFVISFLFLKKLQKPIKITFIVVLAILFIFQFFAGDAFYPMTYLKHISKHKQQEKRNEIIAQSLLYFSQGLLEESIQELKKLNIKKNKDLSVWLADLLERSARFDSSYEVIKNYFNSEDQLENLSAIFLMKLLNQQKMDELFTELGHLENVLQNRFIYEMKFIKALVKTKKLENSKGVFQKLTEFFTNEPKSKSLSSFVLTAGYGYFKTNKCNLYAIKCFLELEKIDLEQFEIIKGKKYAPLVNLHVFDKTQYREVQSLYSLGYKEIQNEPDEDIITNEELERFGLLTGNVDVLKNTLSDTMHEAKYKSLCLLLDKLSNTKTVTYIHCKRLSKKRSEYIILVGQTYEDDDDILSNYILANSLFSLIITPREYKFRPIYFSNNPLELGVAQFFNICSIDNITLISCAEGSGEYLNCYLARWINEYNIELEMLYFEDLYEDEISYHVRDLRVCSVNNSFSIRWQFELQDPYLANAASKVSGKANVIIKDGEKKLISIFFINPAVNYFKKKLRYLFLNLRLKDTPILESKLISDRILIDFVKAGREFRYMRSLIDDVFERKPDFLNYRYSLILLSQEPNVDLDDKAEINFVVLTKSDKNKTIILDMYEVINFKIIKSIFD